MQACTHARTHARTQHTRTHARTHAYTHARTHACTQVQLAVEMQKPLFLHERKAFADFVDGDACPRHMLTCVSARVCAPSNASTQPRAHARICAVLSRHGGSLPPAVVHAFTGTEDELAAYRKLDLYVACLHVARLSHANRMCFMSSYLCCIYAACSFIGVTGFICQKSAALRKWLPMHVPLERLMVETDAPYMGFKGCRTTEQTKNKNGDKYPNVPAALPKVAPHYRNL